MSASLVYEYLDSVANTSSRNEKERLLGTFLTHDLVAKVCRYAYDPFVTFGVSFPETTTVMEGQNDEIDFALLDRLANRRLTGNAAKQALEVFIEGSTNRARDLMRRIIDKDLRIGATAKTLNKARPGLIPTFEVMLAHKFKEKKIKSWPVAAEVKHDGYRCPIEVDPPNGRVTFYSRSGLADFADMPHIAERLLNAGPSTLHWIDGELTEGDHFNDTGKLRRKGAVVDTAVLHVFEILTPNEFKSGSNVTYQGRRQFLEKQSIFNDHVRLTEMRICHNMDELMAFYQEQIDAGGEGIIVKPLDGLYEPKRSYAWMKIKAQETEDLVIVDAYEGNGKLKGTLGGVIVDRNGVEVRVGGGFSDELRDELWKDFRPDGTELRRNLVGRVIEVAFHEVTPDGSLRHPRFVRFRDDKE